jgi:hypothetical protein
LIAVVANLAEVVRTTGPDVTLLSENQCVELATANLPDFVPSDCFNFRWNHHTVLQACTKAKLSLVCITTDEDLI